MGFPTKKLPRVNTSKLSESNDKGVSGLEFGMFSICVVTLKNSSKVNLAPSTTLFKWCLKVFTPASHRPPKLGILGGANFLLMLSEVNRFETSFIFFYTIVCKRFSSVEAATKFVALSLNDIELLP